MVTNIFKANIKISIRSLKYFGFALILLFSDILRNGNLNLIYMFGILIIFSHLIKKRYFYRIQIQYMIPLLGIMLVFLVFTDQPFTLIKMIVYLAKMLINIALFSFFQKSFGEARVKDCMRCVIFVLSIILFSALIFHNNSVLWRLNDPYNFFSKTRLQLLFSEPSVLGFFVGILLIFLFYSLIEFGIDRLCMFGLLVSLLCLILSFSLSGIVYTAVAVLYLVTVKFLRQLVKPKINVRILVCVLIFTSALFFILVTENDISNRIAAILSGTDGSFNYRWYASTESLRSILSKTNYLGLGFGNMNTAEGISLLSSVGIDNIFANSFLYFIAEAGILGIFYLFFILTTCFKNIKKNGCSKRHDCAELKMALLIFVFISQIAGGYFTDPLIWCLYGIICSDIKRNNLEI